MKTKQQLFFFEKLQKLNIKSKLYKARDHYWKLFYYDFISHK